MDSSDSLTPLHIAMCKGQHDFPLQLKLVKYPHWDIILTGERHCGVVISGENGLTGMITYFFGCCCFNKELMKTIVKWMMLSFLKDNTNKQVYHQY